jgi:hypothetical protein
VDSLGRKGYLIHSGNTYSFQPLEISDERASIFERTVPIDSKRRSVSVVLPTEKQLSDLNKVLKPISVQKETKEEQKEKTKGVEGEEKIETNSLKMKYEKIIKELKEKIAILSPTSSITKKSGKNKDWFNNAKPAITLLSEKHHIPREKSILYIIEHFLDISLFSERLIMVQYLFSERIDLDYLKNKKSTLAGLSDQLQDIDSILRDYFRLKIFEPPLDMQIRIPFTILLTNENKNEIYVFDDSLQKGEKWREARTTEKENPVFMKWRSTEFDYQEILLQKVQRETKSLPMISDTLSKDVESNIGFIGILKKKESDGYGFKIKNVLQTRNNFGARCDQADKQVLITKINQFLNFMKLPDTQIYSNDPKFGDDTYVEKVHLCILFELLLRHFGNGTTKQK